MTVTWVGGRSVVKVSAANKIAYKHVDGVFEVVLEGRSVHVGTYAECVQYRDEFIEPTDDYEIVPWFDTSEWSS